MVQYNIFDQITGAIRQQLRDGRSQKEIAQELGMNQCTISSILHGRRRLGRLTYEKILIANPPWLKEIIDG